LPGLTLYLTVEIDRCSSCVIACHRSALAVPAFRILADNSIIAVAYKSTHGRYFTVS